MTETEAIPPTFDGFRFRLQIAGRSSPLLTVESPQSVTVGRDPQCQLQLDQDPAVSRFHCRLEMTPHEVRLIDLGGRNGTFLNEQRVQDAHVRDGDEICCGQTRMRVVMEWPTRNDVNETMFTGQPAERGDEIPAKLAGYIVVKELGRGAMGRVMLAKHPTSKKQVAIKIISPEVALDASRLGLFVREAAVLTRLKHPRIVEVLDFGIQDHWPYLVLEYLPLINLDELVTKSTPADRVRIACRVISLVLEALEHAHSQGFVHRDVKPSNLLAYRDRKHGKLHVKLGDFGLAKSYENAGLSGITGIREVRGTIVFMPPEQILDSRSAGPLSDIYSTGATLYRLLTGFAPYDAMLLGDALSAVLNEDPRPIASRAVQIPQELAAVVHRALARDPVARYSSATEMREALQVFGRRR